MVDRAHQFWPGPLFALLRPWEAKPYVAWQHKVCTSSDVWVRKMQLQWPGAGLKCLSGHPLCPCSKRRPAGESLKCPGDTPGRKSLKCPGSTPGRRLSEMPRGYPWGQGAAARQACLKRGLCMGAPLHAATPPQRSAESRRAAGDQRQEEAEERRRWSSSAAPRRTACDINGR